MTGRLGMKAFFEMHIKIICCIYGTVEMNSENYIGAHFKKAAPDKNIMEGKRCPPIQLTILSLWPAMLIPWPTMQESFV
jgi:hypothetical protein